MIRHTFYILLAGAALIMGAGPVMAQVAQAPVGAAAQRKPGNEGAPAPPEDTILLHIPKRIPGRFFDLSSVFNTGAVSTVSGDVMYKTPTPNITNTLYGRLSGLTVSSGPGEPGNDNANMSIRGIGTYGLSGSGYNAYKIFIDGFESDINNLAYLSPAEIQSISVLKDAAALSTFGMRGANGVLWVETRRGSSSKPTVQIDARTGLQSPTVLTKPLNSYDYANLYNQAISNDNGDVWTPRYSAAQLQAYQNGIGTNVDWYANTLRKNAPSTDGDLVFSGGDSIARYMLVMDYANQQGLYASKNTDSTSNEMLKRYNLRTNLDFNFFKIFEAQVDLGGRIQDWKSPNNTTANIWNALASYPNNIYPVKDTGSGGWSGSALYPNNPVASTLALGWQSTHTRVLQGNFRLKEKLDFITPGLYLDEAASFYSDAVSTYSKTATYGRYYEGATTTTDVTTPIKANAQAPYSQENWQQGTVTLGYNEAFGTSKVHAAINYDQSAYLGDGLYTYEEHYRNISGRGNYCYKDKYIGELGFSYFGSDAYAPGHQWDFYPSLSGAWILSNERFLKSNTAISFLKLRASAGLTGSTDSYATGATLPAFNGRYLYQQYYQAASQTGGTFYTGNSGPTQMAVLTPLYIANPNIGPERSLKYNIGADMVLLRHLDLTADAYMDKRSRIITQDNAIPGDFGINPYFENIGKMTSKGLEISGNYDNRIGNLGYTLTGMASYNNNKINYENEVSPAYPYNAQTGRPYGTQIGLVATGFYQLSDFNADGSLKSGVPVPAFGPVQPGDLKYKDLNGDGKVDQTDVTAIGKSPFPRFTYSFGADLRYKGFDLGAFFQGASGATVDLLNSAPMVVEAFVNNGTAYPMSKGAWAYYPGQGIDTRATATYPRLTTIANTNNYRTSSFWIRSGDFLRLRNLELGYSLASRTLHRMGMSKLRFYVNAVNPITWSSLYRNYHMDPESVTGYPPLKSYNAGFSATF